jgi:hypothetical protein
LPQFEGLQRPTPPWVRTIRDDLKYSWGGVMKPPTPWIGSAINPATLRQVELPCALYGVHDVARSGPSPPRALVSVIAGGGAAMIKVAERHDLAVSRETTRRQDSGFVGLGATNGKQRLSELPARVSDAIFFASAASGSAANKLETRSSVSSCGCTFALTSSFERPTLTVCDDAPKKSRY